ncbi:MAG: formylmethanofuran--tetrahydromethanopterin N-formyltransferase [Gemmataceae bacterium]
MFTVNQIPILDTFAEAFPMTAARLIVTAVEPSWALAAAQAATGFASSVIGCDCEAGIEGVLSPDQTPDGRPGVALLFFAFSREALQKALLARIGQCILTCPTTACYNGLEASPERRLAIGGQLRFFGDGWQSSKVVAGRRFWRIPVMDGEFLCEESFGTVKGVAGGNFLLLGRDPASTLAAARAAILAIDAVGGVITPFPGGIVRSGSKIGSRYAKLKASTNEAYCPTLRPLVHSQLTPEVGCVYEIVLDGLDQVAVESAMRAGILAACTHRTALVQITAGNYGGKLGP